MSVDYDQMAKVLREEITVGAQGRELTREEGQCLSLLDERERIRRRLRWISLPDNAQRVGCYPANYPRTPFALIRGHQESLRFRTLEELIDYAIHQEDAAKCDAPAPVKIKSRKAIIPPAHTHDKGTAKR